MIEASLGFLLSPQASITSLLQQDYHIINTYPTIDFLVWTDFLPSTALSLVGGGAASDLERQKQLRASPSLHPLYFPVG